MATHQALLKQICDLNDQAIFLLTCGMDGKAIVAALRGAMLTLDQLFSMPNPPDFLLAPQPCMPFHTVPVHALKDDGFYVFNHAISLQMASENSSVANANMAYYSAAMTFNMALTYHQFGLLCGDSRKLQVACNLYRNCVEMAANANGVPPPTPGDARFVLQMMALNNSAQIHYCSTNFSQSQELLSQVSFMVEQIQGTNEMVSLPPEALDEISLNAMVCKPPTTAPMA